MIISAVLLPNEQDTERLIQHSVAINKRADSIIQLSNHYLPHVTVAQFIAPPEAAENLWEHVSRYKTHVTELISAGLVIVPSFEHNETWIELQFLKSAALAELQSIILKSEFANKYQLHSGTGDKYRPHCTLALLNGFTVPSLDLSKQVLFRRRFQDLKLAVGLNGENFTFVETKYS